MTPADTSPLQKFISRYLDIKAPLHQDPQRHAPTAHVLCASHRRLSSCGQLRSALPQSAEGSGHQLAPQVPPSARIGCPLPLCRLRNSDSSEMMTEGQSSWNPCVKAGASAA